ncbi:MAG: toll/interleukin-1 receptor domain-containing protein [Thermomonas sp.]
MRLTGTQMHYRAFISYSHADSRWARWVQRRVENYRLPSRLRGTQGEFGRLPDRLGPFFRDREDLSSAGELGPRIQLALADSEALIVLCSPEAARSPWVDNEILQFKRMGREDRIFALILSGEPNAGDQRECFPRALRFELDDHGNIGSTPAEPVAADMRTGKDGRSLARLKLLSGMLGLPLDTLRQREAARQHRRQFAITALAILIMMVTSLLAIQAVRAQHAAERRQKQAEALVNFMLGDLTDRLTEVSRLDILQAVNDQAMTYFKSLPTADFTDESLQQRAKTFVKIGNVRRDQGLLPQALQSFQAAARIASKLADAKPDDLVRQLAYSEIHASIGTVHWYQGELDQAQAGFEAARKIVEHASTLKSSNADVLSQISYLDNNIGHVLEARGRLGEALVHYHSMLAICERLVAMAPDEKRWQIYLGLAHNNLAKMALMDGDLPTAVERYRADVAIETKLSNLDSRNNEQAEKLLISRAALGRTLALTGAVDAGIGELRQTMVEATHLLGIEPKSTSFVEDVGLYGTELARWLRVRGDAAEAGQQLSQAMTVLARLATQDPSNIGWQRELAEARIEHAEQLRAAGQLEPARQQATQALAVLEPQLAQQPNDRSIVLASVEARLLGASLDSNAGRARTLREKALQTIASQTSGQNDPRLLALKIEALLGLGQRQQALALLPGIWKTGYRDPAFVALLASKNLDPALTNGIAPTLH